MTTDGELIDAIVAHRTLTRLSGEGGVRLDRAHQLDFGGNTDFLNMLEQERLISKKISKTRSVTSQLDDAVGDDNMGIGPSDHALWPHDRKSALTRREGRGTGDVPVNVELKLEAHAPPNSAAILIDALRCSRPALQGTGSYFLKSPPQPYTAPVARRLTDQFITAHRRREAERPVER
ncbi:MAG TPA: hypothetical protein VIA06_12530 [Candidatus Dormibacteraeota bacterium]|nr:hypothetical protein [Candidatus Dormibacteraeota bacterium]